MIKIPFLTLELLFTAVWLLCRIVVWIRQRKIDLKREELMLLLYLNMAVILRITFFPMLLKNGNIRPLVFDPSAIIPFRLNLIPFVNISVFRSVHDMLLNLVGNVVMFVPCGILLPILYPKLDNFWKVTAFGAAMSLGIELSQLLFKTRVTDVDDLILNTAGVMIGYGIYALARALWKKKHRPSGGA